MSHGALRKEYEMSHTLRSNLKKPKQIRTKPSTTPHTHTNIYRPHSNTDFQIFLSMDKAECGFSGQFRILSAHWPVTLKVSC